MDCYYCGAEGLGYKCNSLAESLGHSDYREHCSDCHNKLREGAILIKKKEAKVGDKVRWNGKSNRYCASTPAEGRVTKIEVDTAGRGLRVYVRISPEATNYYHPDELELVAEGTSVVPEVKLTKAYKVFRVLEDGSLCSVYAGNEKSSVFPKGKGVAYKVGEVAVAPEGQKGLTILLTLEDVKSFSEANLTSSKKVTHEVTAIGNTAEEMMAGASQLTCRALIVGKQVEEATPPKPTEPVWKDITAECEVRLTKGGPDFFIDVRHAGVSRVWLGAGKPHSVYPDLYRIIEVPYHEFNFKNFRIERKED